MLIYETRFGGDAPGLPGLWPPAPLPSLPDAFARRRAVFGQVEAEPPPTAFPEPPEAAEARALHRRRALYQALEYGCALLDAIGLPPLALDVIDDGIRFMDEIDAPTEDLEPWLAGFEMLDMLLDGEDDDSELEPSLGSLDRQADQTKWADGSIRDLEHEDEDDLTAPERHGRGFFRRGADDAEDSHAAEGLNDEGGDEAEEIGIPAGLVRGRPLSHPKRATLRALVRQAKAMRRAVHV